MKTASKNLVQEKVPVFTDRVKKATNAYIGSDPAKSNLDRYILKVRFGNLHNLVKMMILD